MDTLIFLFIYKISKCQKGYLKKRTNKNKQKEPTSTVQNFIQKKKKKNNGKKKVEKDKKLAMGGRRVILSSILFLLFSPFWRDWIVVGLERKWLGPTTFLSPSPSHPNTLPTHFLSYFPLFFFHPSKHNVSLCLSLSLYLKTKSKWESLSLRLYLIA